MNFSLMQHHKYSLTELENMVPWERDVYVTMLVSYINEENEKIKAKAKIIVTGKHILDRKSTRLNSSHSAKSRMPSSA